MAGSRDIYADSLEGKKMRYWRSTGEGGTPKGFVYRSKFDMSERSCEEITFQEYRAAEKARKANTGHAYNVWFNPTMKAALEAEAKRLNMKPQQLIQSVMYVYLNKRIQREG